MKFRLFAEQASAKRAKLPRILKFCQCSSTKQNFKRHHKVNQRFYFIFKRGFQYRYCFDLFQHVLFILTQAMQKKKIKTKTFVINYCVLDLSKICINSSHPSFHLVGGYNKFSSRTTYSKYSTNYSSTSFIIIVASSI